MFRRERNGSGSSRKYMEKYSRGRRGAPAKGVGRIYPAREFKSLLLRHESPCKSRTFSFFTTQNPIPPHTRIFYKAPSFSLVLLMLTPIDNYVLVCNLNYAVRIFVG